MKNIFACKSVAKGLTYSQSDKEIHIDTKPTPEKAKRDISTKLSNIATSFYKTSDIIISRRKIK